jgi:hypothetical protein
VDVCPHVFVQRLGADGRLLEVGQRADAAIQTSGHVLEAPYLEPVPGLLGRLARGLSGEGFDAEPRLRFPFTAEGGDALGYFDGPAPADASILRLGGVIHGGSVRGPVVRDLWITGSPPVRACEMVDFAVIDPQGTCFVVSCGLAPIVIGRPRPIETVSAVVDLHPRTRQLMREVGPPHGDGRLVEVRSGDTVEVLGLARPLGETARRIDLERLRSPYRDREPPRPGHLIGDEDGTRVVLRVVGERS